MEEKEEFEIDKKEIIKNWESSMKYYFPTWCSADFAPFHKNFAEKVINNKSIFIMRAWARDHAKTTFTQMLIILLVLCEEVKTLLYVSKNKTNAAEMVKALKSQFETNHFLKEDFGDQKTSAWNDTKLELKNGCTIRALGKMTPPRGAKNDEKRPDCIIFDDFDDDIGVNNPETITKEFEWLMGALFGCFSVDGNNGRRFIGLGNIIGKDCIIKRAAKQADDYEQINLLTPDRKHPSWSERFTMKDCNYMIDKMGYLSEREYFNNPEKPSDIFKASLFVDETLKQPSFDRLIAFSRFASDSEKALILMGIKDNNKYIIACKCSYTSITNFLEWHKEIKEFEKVFKMPIKFFMTEKDYKKTRNSFIRKKIDVRVSIDFQNENKTKDQIEFNLSLAFESKDIIFLNNFYTSDFENVTNQLVNYDAETKFSKSAVYCLARLNDFLKISKPLKSAAQPAKHKIFSLNKF